MMSEYTAQALKRIKKADLPTLVDIAHTLIDIMLIKDEMIDDLHREQGVTQALHERELNKFQAALEEAEARLETAEEQIRWLEDDGGDKSL